MLEYNNAAVIFGLPAVWYAGCLFAIAYFLIITERLNRAIVSMMAASLMILGGVLTQKSAIDGIDFNTLGLLTGMMIIVSIAKKSGVFQYLAINSVKLVKADPWYMLIMLVFVTAALSALFDNVTTVLLVVPVTLLVTDTLKISAYPYLFAEIFASNIGGTATLIGDPPNIMIGSAAGLSYNDFLLNLAPVAALNLLVFLIPVYFIWGRKLSAEPSQQQAVMHYSAAEAITDPLLLKQSLFVISLVTVGFMVGHGMGIQPATIAMFGAALLLLLHCWTQPDSEQSKTVHSALCDVEWVTIFFFIGLFILVYGIETTGLLQMLADMVIEATGGDKLVTAMSILFASAVASAVVDNIPFVATMIPMIDNMAVHFGGADEVLPLWWSLALGSCLGGNGSLVGASANLIVAGIAERAGQPIRFMPFMLMAFPLMMMSVAISAVYVYFRYF